MSPDIRDALDVACGVGGDGGKYMRPVEVQRRPVGAAALRARLIAFLQECPEDWTVREMLEDLREGLHVSNHP